MTSVCLLPVLKLSDWSLVTSLHISQVTTQISPTCVITPCYHFVHSKTAISIIFTLSPTRPTLFQIFIPFSLSATQYLNHNFKLMHEDKTFRDDICVGLYILDILSLVSCQISKNTEQQNFKIYSQLYCSIIREYISTIYITLSRGVV